jgi:hypothetical protein
LIQSSPLPGIHSSFAGSNSQYQINRPEQGEIRILVALRKLYRKGTFIFSATTKLNP